MFIFGVRAVTEADLIRAVTIRGEAHSVRQAVNCQVAHHSYYFGQIVLLAKHFERKPLSVPRGKSGEFNQQVGTGKASQR